MKQSDGTQTQQQAQEQPDYDEPIMKEAPRWAVFIGIILLGILYAALPATLTFGPTWLPLLIMVILLLPFLFDRLTNWTMPHRTARTLGFSILAIITLALVISVIFLIYTLATRTPGQAGGLLRSAGLLWLCNILVFGLWYWEVDGGGPRT